MSRIGKIFGQISPTRIGQSAGFALAILLFPALILQVSPTAEAQVEDTAWRDLAVTFLAAPDSFATVTPAQTPFDLTQMQTFTRDHITRSIRDRQQLDCLTTAIYYEARSEPLAGQLAVAQVVLNRVDSKHYPSSICEVVYQGSYRTTGCQFSFTCDGSLAKAPRDTTWARVQAVSINAMLDMKPLSLGQPTHYHTVAVNPVWSATLLRTANVGSHVFYRFPNRREKAALFKDI